MSLRRAGNAMRAMQSASCTESVQEGARGCEATGGRCRPRFCPSLIASSELWCNPIQLGEMLEAGVKVSWPAPPPPC
jgi:hypothetical protein